MLSVVFENGALLRVDEDVALLLSEHSRSRSNETRRKDLLLFAVGDGKEGSSSATHFFFFFMLFYMRCFLTLRKVSVILYFLKIRRNTC